MARYYHAQQVILDKCRGHLTCLRRCPTEAIRVKKGKARISDDLCIDCGICISVCPSNAIVPLVDAIDGISNYKYKVVVPSPVLYSQFDPQIHPYIIHLAFKNLGFDLVVDEAIVIPSLEKALIRYIEEHRSQLPLISPHCPAIVRLIQVNYPNLTEHILPIEVPREAAAREIKLKLQNEQGLKPEEIGIIFISPCPAKIVSIKQPAEKSSSWFDSAFSIQDVYPLLLAQVKTISQTFDESMVPKDFVFNLGWSTLGSISRSTGMENWLAVSGIDHVKKIFDDIENSHLSNIEFVEALSCMLGCIGGPYIVENPYVVRANNKKQRDKYTTNSSQIPEGFEERYKSGYYFLQGAIKPRPTKFFDTDLQTSIRKLKEREKIYSRLPQTDCGLCGAPTCRAFAEDVVRGEADLFNCIIFTAPDTTDNRELIVP
ncbi:MAG: 4Fe-4S binding protein [Anaerolineae bacterium]|nr:4Fe-4S binding protein [Anaerolineae bacterium]